MSSSLIWIDLEMTGLRPESDHILEIATVVTDTDLKLIAEGPVLAIQQSDAVLATMGSWVQQQHQRSGLTERVRQSHTTVQEAERQTLTFLQQHLKSGESPMCGNSICMDRRFLYRYMPELESFFHYRHLDVSTLKVLASHWGSAPPFVKQSQHLALFDIYDSIEELKYYRQHLFQVAP